MNLAQSGGRSSVARVGAPRPPDEGRWSAGCSSQQGVALNRPTHPTPRQRRLLPAPWPSRKARTLVRVLVRGRPGPTTTRRGGRPGSPTPAFSRTPPVAARITHIPAGSSVRETKENTPPSCRCMASSADSPRQRQGHRFRSPHSGMASEIQCDLDTCSGLPLRLVEARSCSSVARSVIAGDDAISSPVRVRKNGGGAGTTLKAVGYPGICERPMTLARRSERSGGPSCAGELAFWSAMA